MKIQSDKILIFNSYAPRSLSLRSHQARVAVSWFACVSDFWPRFNGPHNFMSSTLESLSSPLIFVRSFYASKWRLRSEGALVTVSSLSPIPLLSEEILWDVSWRPVGHRLLFSADEFRLRLALLYHVLPGDLFFLRKAFHWTLRVLLSQQEIQGWTLWTTRAKVNAWSAHAYLMWFSSDVN